MIVAFALLEAGLWTAGRTQIELGFVMLSWVALSILHARETAGESGLSLAGFRASLWVIPVALAIAGLMIAGSALSGALHELHGARTPILHSAGYAVWALVQEIMAQSFYFLRLESLFENPSLPGSGSKRAVVATASLFSFAHVPNPVLLLTSFVMGFALSEVFRRYRNIYPLSIAHAILGLALAMSLPESVTHHMRVGLAFWK